MCSDDQSAPNSYYSRRKALAVGAGGLAATLGGCQALSSSDDTRMLELIVENTTPEPQEVEVEVEQDPVENWRHYHYTNAPGVDYDAQVFVLIARLENTERDVIRFLPGP